VPKHDELTRRIARRRQHERDVAWVKLVVLGFGLLVALVALIMRLVARLSGRL
jgi:hypothetical protein